MVQSTAGHADASNYGFESAVYILTYEKGSHIDTEQFNKLVNIFGAFAAVAAPTSPAKESPARSRAAQTPKTIKRYVHLHCLSLFFCTTYINDTL